MWCTIQDIISAPCLHKWWQRDETTNPGDKKEKRKMSWKTFLKRGVVRPENSTTTLWSHMEGSLLGVIPNSTNPMLRPETASPSLSKRWGKQVGNILTDHCRRINLESLTVSCYFKHISGFLFFFFFDVKNNAASRNKLEIGLSFCSPAFKQKCLCSCAAWAGRSKQVEGRTHIVLLSFLQI